MRTLAERILTRQGYEVLEAASTPSARSRSRDRQARPAPHRRRHARHVGQGPRQRLREVHADLRVLFMSGYTDNALDRYGLDASGDSLLQKPFNGRELLTAVQEALATDRPRRRWQPTPGRPRRPIGRNGFDATSERGRSAIAPRRRDRGATLDHRRPTSRRSPSCARSIWRWNLHLVRSGEPTRSIG